MTFGVVRGFEPVYIDISGYELSAVALGAIDLATDGSQPSAAAAYPCQLVGPGIFAVLGSLRAIFRGNLAVVAALCAIVSCNLAVVDCSYPAVRGVGALRGGPDACVLRSLAIGRRAIPCGSVEVTRRVVTRFSFLIAQPGREVTIPRRQTRLPTADSRLFVGPRIFAVLRGMGAIFGSNLAVIDGSYSAVGSLSTPRVGPGTFVSRTLTVARRAIPRSSVPITGRVVARFGFSVA